MSTIRSTIRRAAWLFGGFVMVVLTYLAVAQFVGARVAGESVAIEQTSDAPKRQVFMITSLLHVDIALPFDQAMKERLSFLRGTSVPVDHPNMRYVVIGWGSRAFYTTAGTYWDIRPAAVAKAVMGDTAVLRFVGTGPISKQDGIVPMNISEAQLEALIVKIEQTFRLQNASPRHLAEESIGPNDAFFEAKGTFNIFNPCNQWLGTALRQSGLKLGFWTPTTSSLMASLRAFGHVK
ncbi:MAG: TIGR02117 family protein [Pseudomonadota bacterium]